MASEASQAVEAIPDTIDTHVSETQFCNPEERISQGTSESTFSSSQGLFVRPSSAGDDMTQQFKFGRAQKQHLNFTGNRKGPAAAQASVVAPALNAEASHPSTAASPPNEPPKEQEPTGMGPEGQGTTWLGDSAPVTEPFLPDTVPSTSHEAENPEPPVVRQKRRKKKPLQPLLQQPENAELPPIDIVPEIPKMTGQDTVLATDIDTPMTEGLATDLSRPLTSLGGEPSDAALHRVSDRNGPVRVVKKNKGNPVPQGPGVSQNPASIQGSDTTSGNPASGGRPARKAPAAQSPATSAPLSGQPSIAHIFQFLGWMVQEDQRKQAQAVQDQKATQQRELTSINAAKQAVETELARSRQENQDLAAKLQQREEKLGRYNDKVLGLQKFVTGLGNDFHKLQTESKDFQRQCSELAAESEVQKAERDLLKQDIAACVKKSAHISKDVEQTASEAAACIQGLEQSKAFLEKQMGEKVGVLVEERDRRVALEKQLQTTIDSQETIKTLIERSENHMIDGMLQLAGDIEENHGKLAKDRERIVTQLSECLSAIQEFKNSDTTAASDVHKMQEEFVELSAKLDKCLDSLKGAHQDAGYVKESLEIYVSEQLHGLRKDFDQSQSLHAQLDALRESHANLAASVVLKDERISSLQEQLSSLLSVENAYKGRIADLEAEIARLKSLPVVDGNAEGLSRLSEVDVQTAHLRRELENARTEILKGAEKLRMGAEIEEDLRSQLAKLQSDLRNAEGKTSAAIAEKAELERKASENLNEMRKNLSKEARRLRQEDIADYENKLHQANKKKADAEASLKEASSALLSMQERVQQLNDQVSAKDIEISTLIHAHTVSDAKIRDLQHFIDTAGLSKEDDESTKRELTLLKEQSQSKNVQITLMEEEQAANLSKLGALQGMLEQAEAARHAAEAAAVKAREEGTAALQEAKDTTSKELQQYRESLHAVENARKEGEAAVERTRKKAEAAIKDIQERSVREKEALHQQLAEVETARKGYELKLQGVRRDAEEALKKQQDRTRSDIGELQRRLSEAEAATEQVRRAKQDELERQKVADQRQLNAAKERALQAETELAELRNNLRAQIERHVTPRRLSNGADTKMFDSQNTQGSSYAVKVPASNYPSHSHGDRPTTSRVVETPPAAVESEHFKKPRRKVDRNSNSVISIEHHSQTTAEQPSQVHPAERQLLEKDDASRVPLLQEATPETQPETRPTLSFSQFNESLGGSPQAPQTSSSSMLSDVENIRTPSDLAASRSQQKRPAAPDETRVLQELAVETVSQRSMSQGRYEHHEVSSSTGPIVENDYDDPFFSFHRPKSQANMASRMAPSTQNIFMRQLPSHAEERSASTVHTRISQGAPQPSGTYQVKTKSGGSSSPPFIQHEPTVTHKVTTYHQRLSRPPSSTKSPAAEHGLKRRSSGGLEPFSSKRAKTPAPVTPRTSTKPGVAESQSSSAHPLGSSRMRSSQTGRGGSGKASRRKSASKKDRYNLRFAQETANM